MTALQQIKGWRPWERLALAALVALAVIRGGAKPGIRVADPYLRDAGCLLTNDTAHVAVAKATPILPDDAQILVHARPGDSSDPADYARLEPHLTYADHPHDYPLPGATNWEVVVTCSYAPAPTVHTNGVWAVTGFTIPGDPAKAAFPNTRMEPIQ